MSKCIFQQNFVYKRVTKLGNLLYVFQLLTNKYLVYYSNKTENVDDRDIFIHSSSVNQQSMVRTYVNSVY